MPPTTSRTLRIAPIAAAAVLCATAAHAREARLYLAPYGLQSHMTGEGRFTGGNSIPGTDFSLEDTLGVDPDVSGLGIDGWVKLLGSRIAFSYQEADLDGEERLDANFTIDGVTYGASERVETDVDYRRAKVMFGWDFGLKFVNVGFLVGVHAFQADVAIASSSGVTQSEELKAPIPAVGFTLGIHPIASLAIHVEATGLDANVGDIEATLIDGYAGIDWLPLWKFGVTVGYRYFRLEALHEDDDNFFDLTQRGPYAGIVLHL